MSEIYYDFIFVITNKLTKYCYFLSIIKSIKQTAFRKFKEQTNHYRQHSVYIDYVKKRNERFIRTNFKEKNRENIESMNKKFYKSKFSDANIEIITATTTIIASTAITSEIQNTINEAIRQYVLTNSLVLDFSESLDFTDFSRFINTTRTINLR